MKVCKKNVRYLVITGLFFLLAACGGGGGSNPPPTSTAANNWDEMNWNTGQWQ